MRATVIVGALLFVSLLFFPSYGGDVMEKQQPSEARAIAHLAKLTPDQQIELLDRVSRDRVEMQSLLISQLTTAESADGRLTAAYLLGMYRMEATVLEVKV